MACGCNKGRATLNGDTQTALTASTAVYYEVYRQDVFTGRRFTSLLSAQRYADSIGGTVLATA
jgi:hypothetical protein